MIEAEPIDAGAGALDAIKTYLRISQGQEDELLQDLVASAVDLCEQFTGQAVLVRSFAERIGASSAWTRLRRLPVRAISSVEMVEADAFAPLPPGDYSIDIDAAARGWVRLSAPVPAKIVRVHYSAGIASAWDEAPEALRHGIVRLAAHLYTHRERPEDSGPPAVVTALWRPYRALRLA